MLSHFPCSPVIRECLWNKTQINRIIYKVHLELTKRGTEEICYTNNRERSIKLLKRKNGLVQAGIMGIMRIQIRSKVKTKTACKKIWSLDFQKTNYPRTNFRRLFEGSVIYLEHEICEADSRLDFWFCQFRW